LADTAGQLREALRDRYLVDREIGQGGMATVWLARDLKHDRPVAIKVLRPDLAAVLGGERFLREIRLTAQLQHPHILSLLDSGAAGGLLYYVMPYVEGESLRDRLTREGQLPLDDVLSLTRMVASALDYAHQRGVIHRDIKPENILLHQGEPMVADFGVALAAASAGRERLTETGLSLGTPAYMSPEQASAEPRLDGRTDQYSLACVVYEMLAGEPPYTGPTAQAIIAKRLSEPVPHVGTLRAVPPGVEAAITRALARSPADRFASVTEFVNALLRPLPPRRWTRRTAALAGGAAVLATMLLLAFLFRPRASAGPIASRQLTFTGRATEPALSPDGKSVAYVSHTKSLIVQRLDGGEPTVLVPPSRWLFKPRWTGDGTAIVVSMMPDSSRNAATWMVPSAGGPPHEVLPDIDAFDAGPDSLTAIWSQREKHAIEVLDLRTRRVRQAIRLPDSLGIVDDIAWSPDRRWVLVQAKGIWVTPLDGGPSWRLSRSGWQPRWSAAGDAVFFLDGPRGTTDLKRVGVDPRSGEPEGGPISVLSLPTADRFSLGPHGTMIHTQVALSSQALAISYGSGVPARIEQTRVLTEGTGWVNTLSITDDGEQVALSRGRGGESSIEVVPFHGGASRTVAGSPAEELGPSWSPDGRKLAFVRLDSTGSRLMLQEYPDGAGQRLGSLPPIWSWLTRTADQSLLPPLWYVTASWSMDGRWLSYPAADFRRIGVIDLVRQAESELVIPDSLGALYVGAVASPDGGELVVSTLHRWNDWGELWVVTRYGGRWRRLREPFGESYPLRWRNDGWLYVINNHAYFTDGGPARLELWRLPTRGGDPQFVAPVPEGCGAYTVSNTARRAVCDFNTRQTDLVMVTGIESGGR
jgi:Tol biopolymer transport system component